MSEKDVFDWSDDADFESLADEPMEGFADFDDEQDFDSIAEDMPLDEPDAFSDLDEAEMDPLDPDLESPPVPQPTVVRSARRRGIAGGRIAFLFSASTLIGAAGVGSASLLAMGVDPTILWQPAALMRWRNYLDLQNHPLNTLALICLGVVALTLLGSWAIAKAANGANARARASEDMLDRITSLRLENENPWQDPAFKSCEPAAAFVSETLGAWRLQASRQKRLTGLDGEIHRLGKALSDNSGTDLAGRFDNPSVGMLADEMSRQYDERAALNRELASLRDKDQQTAGEIMQILQDARCWHDASERNLGLQGAAVDRLASRLQEVVDEGAETAGNGDAGAVLDAFKTEFDRIRVSAGKAPAGSTELSDLVDKTSKLAFQIAMEVARLGPRGERLAPMSQSLEDLSTEFRGAADRANAEGSPGQQWSDSLDRLAGKLAELESAVRGADSDWPQRVRQCGPAARQLAANLSEIVQSYGPQAERLTNLGGELAGFSGAEFDPADLSSGNPDNPPAGVLTIEGRTPFTDDETAHNGGGIHQPADVDPFAVTPQPKVVEAPGDPDFQSSVGDPDADIFGSGLDRNQLPELEIETSFGMEEEEGPDPETGDAPPAEKVYDLDDFGAVPAAATEEVFELEDLGATPLPADPVAAPAEPSETVYDLADFGAVPLEAAADPETEEVFDLQEFGAVRLA